MTEHNSKNSSFGLPDNAYSELKPGEEYIPIMSPKKEYPEVTVWSVFWGLIMAVLFSAAAAYLGLKIGQVFEAAIPIAIIAVGLSTLLKRKNALGENVIIQSIGATSGTIVDGAIYLLHLAPVLRWLLKLWYAPQLSPFLPATECSGFLPTSKHPSHREFLGLPLMLCNKNLSPITNPIRANLFRVW